MFSKVCFWYGTVAHKRIILLAKLAAAVPFAKIANYRCVSSLTLPTIHSKCAENEDIFAITFSNFAKLLWDELHLDLACNLKLVTMPRLAPSHPRQQHPHAHNGGHTGANCCTQRH
jgi:hypothetical protein